MIYLSLFWEFLKIGMFSFGGAYGAIPLIQDAVLQKGWMNEAMFANVLAISESTPGPIMVNSATYIGNQQGGILGALLATLGVILPAFVIILVITKFLRKFIQSRPAQAVLNGVAPCLMGIILATGVSMLFSTVLSIPGRISVDWMAAIILGVLLIGLFVYKKLTKKELSPILLIVISAVLGIFLYA